MAQTKGDQRVGQRVDAVRQEDDDEQKRDLLDQDQLPPVQLPEIAEAHVDELRRHRAEHGRMERVGHLPVKSGFEVQVARPLCVFLRAGLDFATIAGFIIRGKREGSGWKRI